jgi:1-acyl-sn-glycerol-3-phosphate acyltransferase
MFRYYWTLFVAGLLLLVMGTPLIIIGHILRIFFGASDFIFPYAKFACRIYLRAAGARVHVKGVDQLDRDQAYVFVANHQSNLDPPLLFAHLGHNVGAIAKKELLKVPLFKQGFPLAHVVTIDRSDRESAIASTKRGAEELRRGHSLMAFPEGTRSVDGTIGQFKKGIFYMAVEAGVPIAPVAINNTGMVMGKGAGRCIPGDVSLEVLTPISTQGYSMDNIEELIGRVRSQIISRVHPEG